MPYVDDPRCTPEQNAWSRKDHEEHEAYRRWFNDCLEFWRACERPRCAREHTCSDDPHACFARRWKTIPEPEKVWLRAGMRALGSGMAFEDAERVAHAELERWTALQEEVKRMLPHHAAE
jgi:hypothetical protein